MRVVAAIDGGGHAERVTVLIVLFDGVQSLDVTGPLEVFTGAGYEVATASPGRHPVRTSSGLTLVPGLDLATAALPRTVVVPGGEGTRAGNADVVEWLRRHARAIPRVMAVCSGAFLLAEAGLLAGRRATTHWNFCATLARRYPDVQVDP